MGEKINPMRKRAWQLERSYEKPMVFLSKEMGSYLRLQSTTAFVSIFDIMFFKKC